MSYETAYQSCSAALNAARTDFAHHETYGGDDDTWEVDFGSRVVSMRSTLDRLDMLGRKDASSARRQHCRTRTEQLRRDISDFEAVISASKMRRQQAARERDARNQLLNVAFKRNVTYNNDSTAGSAYDDTASPLYGSRMRQQGSSLYGTSDSTAILIDAELDHQTSLHRSKRGVADLVTQGAAALDRLRDQRNTLISVRKRAVALAATLGLSSTVLRFIERRSDSDMRLFICGCITTCLIMAFIYYTLG